LSRGPIVFGGYTVYDYVLRARVGRTLGKKALKIRLVPPACVASAAARMMKRAALPSGCSADGGHSRDEPARSDLRFCDKVSFIAPGGLPYQELRRRRAGGAATGDQAGIGISKAMMITRSSCRFFPVVLRLQPVRRLERSIRLKGDGHGRPC
jgi:hypothetical protein